MHEARMRDVANCQSQLWKRGDGRVGAFAVRFRMVHVDELFDYLHLAFRHIHHRQNFSSLDGVFILLESPASYAGADKTGSPGSYARPR